MSRAAACHLRDPRDGQVFCTFGNHEIRGPFEYFTFIPGSYSLPTGRHTVR